MKLLLINPNTSRHITERLCAEARCAAGPGVVIEGVNPDQGPAAIRSRADHDAAVASVHAMAQMHLADHDGILLGVSLDTALQSLRPAMRVPVVGMAQGGMTAACLLSDRVAGLTLGTHMLPLYEALTRDYGLSDRLVCWHALEIPSAFTQISPDTATRNQLLLACRALVRDHQASAILLCGAVLCGYGSMLAPMLEVPVIDAMAAATLQLIALVRLQRMSGSLPSTGT